MTPKEKPRRVLWSIDPLCWDGRPHGGGRLFHDPLSEFDPARAREFRLRAAAGRLADLDAGLAAERARPAAGAHALAEPAC